jgi:IclR family KDG regulon transcriptional repressor
VKSLHKVLDIIDMVAKSGSIGIRDLSASTGFPPATIHRMTSTLVERHYLKQDPETKKLSLSIRFLELGTKVQEHFNLTAIARPHLEKLMAETKESVNLAVLDGDRVAYLDHVRSDYSMLQLFTKPGAQVPLYCTGVGKMFMSQWTISQLEEYLKRTPLIAYTARTIVERAKLLDEVTGIRLRGYAVDNEEMEVGVRCVAALVMDHFGKAAGAISISGAAMRVTPGRIKAFVKSLKACSRAISRELGFKGNE